MGFCKESPNGRFIIAWSDKNPEGTRGGNRESGNGSFVFLEEGNAKLRGEAQRPNEGHVANNGTFIIADWMFGLDLNGTLYAYDILGNLKLKHEFNANILNCGISPSGKYAVLQTANNPKNEDGNKLFLFNIESNELIWKKTPDKWADIYQFDEKQGILYLNSKGGNIGSFTILTKN